MFKTAPIGLVQATHSSLSKSPIHTKKTHSLRPNQDRFESSTRSSIETRGVGTSALDAAFKPSLTPIHLPPITRFKSRKNARNFILNAKEQMQSRAKEKMALNQVVSDQDYEPNILLYEPPTPPNEEPLLILGGMGPLAGLEAFEQALTTFQETRRIVLLQATKTPDRTSALLAAKRSPKNGACEKQAVVHALKNALRMGWRVASPHHKPIVLMVSCNTAHAFVPAALEQMDTTTIQWISLVDATVESIPNDGKPTLISGTTGTHLAGLYTEAFNKKNLPTLTPPPKAQELLMKAIYEGIKGFNSAEAIRYGELFIREILSQPKSPTRIVAGCTEIPTLLELLKEKGARDVSEFLQKCEILSPVKQAMYQLRSAETTKLAA